MVISGKATRETLNPDGEQMQEFEEEFSSAVSSALGDMQDALFEGVTQENVMSVLQRMDSEEIVLPLRDTMIRHLQRIAIAGARFGREQVEQEVFGVKQEDPTEIDWQLANNAAAEWARRYGFTLVSQLNSTTRQRLQREIAGFIQNQETIGDLVERLSDVFSPERAELIARTEVTRAFARGNMEAWRESGVIERRRWNTRNDEIVCPICGPLHNQVVGLDEDFPGGIDAPPAHPRCRCWITGVVVEQDRPVGLERFR